MARPVRALLAVPVVVLAACAAPSAASTPGAAAPPVTVRMICSDDIKAKVTQALGLPAAPSTRDTWEHGTYTCRYALPMGEMTLSDRVFADAGTARARMAAEQSGDASAEPLAGLGQQAYGSDRGLAIVLKDDQILTVDTTALPERFGANDQRRTDLAYEVASDVLGCWTGDE